MQVQLWWIQYTYIGSTTKRHCKKDISITLLPIGNIQNVMRPKSYLAIWPYSKNPMSLKYHCKNGIYENGISKNGICKNGISYKTTLAKRAFAKTES